MKTVWLVLIGLAVAAVLVGIGRGWERRSSDSVRARYRKAITELQTIVGSGAQERARLKHQNDSLRTASLATLDSVRRIGTRLGLDRSAPGERSPAVDTLGLLWKRDSLWARAVTQLSARVVAESIRADLAEGERDVALRAVHVGEDVVKDATRGPRWLGFIPKPSPEIAFLSGVVLTLVVTAKK